MGLRIRYCDQCGERVPAEELESGRAVTHQEATYCNSCKQNISGVQPVTQPANEPQAPRRPPTGRGAAQKRASNPSVKTLSGRGVPISPYKSGNKSDRKSIGYLMMSCGAIFFTFSLILYIKRAPETQIPFGNNATSSSSSSSKRSTPKSSIPRPRVPKPPPKKDSSPPGQSLFLEMESQQKLLEKGTRPDRFQEILALWLRTERGLPRKSPYRKEAQKRHATLKKKYESRGLEYFRKQKELADKALALGDTQLARIHWSKFPPEYNFGRIEAKIKSEQSRIRTVRPPQVSPPNSSPPSKPRPDSSWTTKIEWSDAGQNDLPKYWTLSTSPGEATITGKSDDSDSHFLISQTPSTCTHIAFEHRVIKDHIHLQLFTKQNPSGPVANINLSDMIRAMGDIQGWNRIIFLIKDGNLHFWINEQHGTINPSILSGPLDGPAKPGFFMHTPSEVQIRNITLK